MAKLVIVKTMAKGKKREVEHRNNRDWDGKFSKFKKGW